MRTIARQNDWKETAKAMVTLTVCAAGLLSLLFAVANANAQELCPRTDYDQWLRCISQGEAYNPCAKDMTEVQCYLALNGGHYDPYVVFTLPDKSTLFDGTPVPDGSKCMRKNYSAYYGKCHELYVEDQVKVPVSDVFIPPTNDKLWKDEYVACKASVEALNIALSDERAKRQAAAQRANQLLAELGYMCMEASRFGSDCHKNPTLVERKWADEN